ncbi:MAG: penicillin acylase family protein, partial [Desulfobacterales bacterium]|nr:penicillin acylase family protein [Desulfobacterales bacterium]
MLKRKRVLFSFLVFFLFAGSLACQGIARAGAWDTEIKKQVNPIQTTRDDKGVWFVTGDEDASLFDVFEAVGYAEATDRLWQAEKFRRTARGTLAELFGPDYLASDIQARTTGYTDQELQDGYDSLNADAKAVLDGYVAGFNRRIKEVTTFTGILPFEFHALGSVLGTEIRPEPWTPQDVLAWVSTMLKFFDGEATGQGQLDNMALYQELGVKFPATFQYMFQDLRWMNDPDAVVYFDGSPAGERRAAAPAASNFAQADALSSIDFVQLAGDLASRQEKIFESLKNINALVKMGSYAWVVSGQKTTSGNPILYSGPQMDHAFNLALPSIICEGSINAGGLNISGMTMAGMPVIIIGRTPHHAWSMQVGHAHTLDYFSVTPADIIHQRVETIKVAGMPDVEQTVYRTAYGPVVNSDPMISWNYAHWGKEFETIEAYLQAATATSIDEFGAAIDKIALSQHFCYADRDGNFAYWMSGFDPIRAEGADPRFPQLGDGSQDWPEPVQYKPRSTDRNRAEGFYTGWNNKSSMVYGNAPNNPSYYFGPFQRA